MSIDEVTGLCRYCARPAHPGAEKCLTCSGITIHIDEFVRGELGLLRTLEAISKRPPSTGNGARALSEALQFALAGNAGQTGQLLAAEVLVLQSVVARIRTLRDQLALKDDPALAAASVVAMLEDALREP